MTVRLNVPTFERVECVPVHVSIWGYKLEGRRRCGGESHGELKSWEEPVFWFWRVGDALRVDDSRF
jgi:hypothetical protein